MDTGGIIVLRPLGVLARVIFGFALACLAAGLVTVLFVNTGDMIAEPLSRLPATAGQTLDLALLTATHAFIFSAIFILLVAGVGEVFSIRSLTYYLFAGILIAALGFTAQYASEISGQPTIFNNYAIKAFLTAGFFAGFVYWLAAGQFAGRAPALEGEEDGVTFRPTGEPVDAVAEETTEGEPAPKKEQRAAEADPEKESPKDNDGGDDDDIVVTRPESRKSRYASLLQRLRRPRSQAPEIESETEETAEKEPASNEDETSVIVRRPNGSPDRPKADEDA